MYLDLGFKTASIPVQNRVPGWARGTDLWADFAGGRGPLLYPTDTHAQTIYAPNAAGLYTPYAANVLTRTDLGLQTVPTRTQLLTHPNDFSNAAWTYASAAQSSGQPDSLGGTSGYLITESGSGAVVRLTANVTVVGSSTYAVSTELKRSNCDWVRVFVGDSTGFTNAVRVWVNLATGAIGSNAVSGTGYGFVSAAVVAETNGIYRLNIIVTAPTTTLNVGMCSASADGSTTRADIGGGAGVGSAYIVGNADLTLGAFAVPPIRTGSATVNGNQQVIDLTGRLGTGVAGFIQFDLRDTGSGAVRTWAINDGTYNNSAALIHGSGSLFLSCYVSLVQTVSINLGAWAVGAQTVAFAVTSNFAKARIVGGSNPAAVTSAAYASTMNKGNIGGSGFNVGDNVFQYAKKLALSFGPQDQTTFDAMYARAHDI